MTQIITHPMAWQAGYADGLAGRPHGTDPLSQVDELAYASGYVEGKAAADADYPEWPPSAWFLRLTDPKPNEGEASDG